jgi:hypothetical protein
MISFKSKYFVAGLEYGVPLIVVAMVSSLIYISFYSEYFRLKNITCYQDFEPCTNPHLVAEVQKLQGENIFLLNTSSVLNHLISGDYLLRDGELHRQLPSTLTLELQSVYPVLALKVFGSEQFATLDPKLRVIRTSTLDPNVPTVMLDSPITLNISQPITDQRVVDVLQKSLLIAQSIPGIKLIKVEGDNLGIDLESGHHALFSSQRDIAEQVSALRSVLSDATITEGVAIIDVRFNQPVLRSQ